MAGTNWRDDRIGSAQRGENPMFIAKMRSGYAFLGDMQFWRGYCVLFAWPQIGKLEDLPFAERNIFLSDLGLLGEVVTSVCSPRRMNYSIYGNTAPFLHAHAFPRYDWEAPERVTESIWTYPTEIWRDFPPEENVEKHAGIRDRIRLALAEATRRYGL